MNSIDISGRLVDVSTALRTAFRGAELTVLQAVYDGPPWIETLALSGVISYLN